MQRIILMLYICIATTLAGFANEKRVLILNSYSDKYRWSHKITETIRPIVAESPDTILHTEYMNSKLCTDPFYQNKLKELYAYKYRDIEFDAIIACDDPALNFLFKYKEELFPNTPVAFCGINNLYEDGQIDRTQYTGIYETYDIVQGFENILKIHPETEEVVVICDSSISASYLLRQIKAIQPEEIAPLRRRYLTDLSLDDLASELSELPESSIVLWGLYLRPANGTPFSAIKSIKFTNKHSTRPIYCLIDAIDNGVVGGRISTAKSQGQTAAELAMRMIKGEAPADIPIIHNGSKNTFDYQQLIRWNIDFDRLPPDSIITNRPFSPFREYRTTIECIIAFIILMLTTIAGLIYAIQKRRAAEIALKNSQDQLLQSEKMSALGELAGGIAHDFNNQLAGVIGYTDLLLPKLSNPDLCFFTTEIKNAALRAAQSTQELLAFSRKGRYEVVPLDLHKIIHQALSLFEHSTRKNITTQLALNAPLSQITGDANQLRNAFLNMALNARDAMPNGGTLHISSELITENKKQAIKVVIRDTGHGMSPETQRQIFEPFFTTKTTEQGAGLSLASTYGTITNHQGHIGVKSNQSSGTTFTITLPLSNQTLPRQSTQTSSTPPSDQTRHILLIEDEPMLRAITERHLQSLNHSVRSCANGLEGLEIYREQPNAFDLVILDMLMPKMNGREAFEAMKAINPEIKAIVASGYCSDTEAQKLFNLGIKAFLNKPYEKDQLTKKIDSILNSPH